MQYLLIVCLLISLSVHSQVAPIPHAHSHNDYQRKRPLISALENGFTSIEADVYLHHGKLKVSHLPIGLFAKKTLEQLYLAPLQKLIEQNGGTLYPNHKVQLILMIDLKGNGAKTYPILEQVLVSYKHLLSEYRNGMEIKSGAIQVLLSGSVPVGFIKADTTALITIDGRLSNMQDTTNQKWITRYSNAWHRYFTWKGRGEMPENEKQLLLNLTTKAHQLQKQIRFYHIPDEPKVWKVLLDNGVDWINTDYPVRFRRFYLEEYRR